MLVKFCPPPLKISYSYVIKQLSRSATKRGGGTPTLLQDLCCTGNKTGLQPVSKQAGAHLSGIHKAGLFVIQMAFEYGIIWRLIRTLNLPF